MLLLQGQEPGKGLPDSSSSSRQTAGDDNMACEEGLPAGICTCAEATSLPSEDFQASQVESCPSSPEREPFSDTHPSKATGGSHILTAAAEGDVEHVPSDSCASAPPPSGGPSSTPALQAVADESSVKHTIETDVGSHSEPLPRCESEQTRHVPRGPTEEQAASFVPECLLPEKLDTQNCAPLSPKRRGMSRTKQIRYALQLIYCVIIPSCCGDRVHGCMCSHTHHP